jgi:hypothetical protein
MTALYWPMLYLRAVNNLVGIFAENFSEFLQEARKRGEQHSFQREGYYRKRLDNFRKLGVKQIIRRGR